MRSFLLFLQIMTLSFGILCLFIYSYWVRHNRLFEIKVSLPEKQPQLRRFKKKIDHIYYLRLWQETYQKWLEAAGKSPKQAEEAALMWIGLQLLASVFISLSQGLILGVCFFLGIGAFLFAVAKWVARDREAAVNMGVYKVYRFIHLQNAAGLSAVETLKHMHESTELSHLREGLRAYSTTYFRTMDPERSEQAMYVHIQGQSASILAATFKQGIELGNFIELVKRQEEIMLKSFYKGLEVKSQALHVKSIFVACSICLFIFLILLMPILFEMQRATEAIFSL